MGAPVRQGESSRLTTLIAAVLVVAVLYWARDVLIPVALAILLCFVLAPLANRLERLGLGRVTSVMVTTLFAGAIVAAVTWSVSLQVVDVIEQLPSYRQNIREKIRDLRGQASGLVGRASERLQDLGREVAEAATESAGNQSSDSPVSPALPADSLQPVPVVIEQSPAEPWTALTRTLSSMLRPLIVAGIVTIFVIFMLLERERLRDRFIRVIGQRRMTLTTQAIDEASQRISRYLVSQLAINVSYGVIAGFGLLLIGVPNALLWGVLAAVLRFIPYLGPWLGALLPILLSVAVFDDWTKPLMTVGMFVMLELVSNNVAEPLVYGSRTGISSLAVLSGVLFWTWLWGPAGLLLATPITVCLVVIGRYVPELEALTVLLGNEPALPEHMRVYQRLLAGDADDALRLSKESMRQVGPEQLYAEILLPVLQMAEHDHRRGAISGDMVQSIRDSMRELLDELAEELNALMKERKGAEPSLGFDMLQPGSGREHPAATKAADAEPVRALCLPVRGEADQLACSMLEQAAKGRSAQFEVASSRLLTAELVELAATGDHDVVIISALPPVSLAAARRLLGEIESKAPDRRILLGLWGARDLEVLVKRLCLRDSTRAVASFNDIMRALDELSHVRASSNAMT